MILLCAGITTVEFAYLPINQSLSLFLLLIPVALAGLFGFSFLTSKRNPLIALFRILLAYSIWCAAFVGFVVPAGQGISHLFDNGFQFTMWLNQLGKWALIQFLAGVVFALVSLFSFFGLKRNIGT